jgi:hypothetical protein
MLRGLPQLIGWGKARPELNSGKPVPRTKAPAGDLVRHLVKINLMKRTGGLPPVTSFLVRLIPEC